MPAIERRDAVGPGFVRGSGGAGEGVDEGNGAGFEPVDACGLERAGAILEADLNQVAGLEHLAAGFEVAALVAVERREGDAAGEEDQECEEG